jgi:hypothetical protein
MHYMLFRALAKTETKTSWVETEIVTSKVEARPRLASLKLAKTNSQMDSLCPDWALVKQDVFNDVNHIQYDVKLQWCYQDWLNQDIDLQGQD